MKEPERPAFTRNVKLLGILIALAVAVLVVSAVVLLMLNSPGDFSTVPRITKVTSSTPQESGAPSFAPPGADETATTSPTSSETSESESPVSAERIPQAPHESGGNHAPSFHPTPGVG